MSMFDEDFLEEEQEEAVESPEESLEDVTLAGMGIACTFAKLFKKHNKDKKIFHPSIKPANLTKQFFKFYLGNCDEDMLSYIIKKKLSRTLQVMFDEAEPVEETTLPELSRDELVEKNIEMLQELLDVKNQLKYLYDLLGQNEKFFEVVKPTKDMIEHLKGIKEGVEQW